MAGMNLSDLAFWNRITDEHNIDQTIEILMDLKSKYEDPDEPAYKDEEIQKFFSSFDRSQSGSDLKENFLRLRGELAGGPESLQTRNQELI